MSENCDSAAQHYLMGMRWIVEQADGKQYRIVAVAVRGDWETRDE